MINNESSLFTNFLKDCLYLQPVQDWDYKIILERTIKERYARITKIAIFLLGSIATTSLIILTEVAVVVLTPTLITLFISIAAWSIFYKLQSLEGNYLADLTDAKKSEILNKRCDYIFFEHKIGQSLDPYFYRKELQLINFIIKTEIFETPFFEKIEILTSKNAPTMTLFEASKTSKISLSFFIEDKKEIQLRFGLGSYENCVKAVWDGIHKDLLSLNVRKKIQGDPQTEQ